MKKCSQCGEVKENSCFIKSNKTLSGLTSECKNCKKKYTINKEYHKEYYQRNKEEINNKNRNNHLRRTYGISTEQYEQLKRNQNGKCAICGGDPTSTLHVDHCHMTGAIRGLLCNTCNSGLGKLKDSTDLLQKAIKYLENPPYKDKD